jgi:hypothetical protein
MRGRNGVSPHFLHKHARDARELTVKSYPLIGRSEAARFSPRRMEPQGCERHRMGQAERPKGAGASKSIRPLADLLTVIGQL